MKLYNTLTKKKEEFVPAGEEVKIYACGPTVYNYIHIGNARPLCVFDILRRYMTYRGMKVCFVQNFTDIDDKLIKKAAEEGVSVADIAKRYIEEFWVDARGLNVMEATIHPKATENIDEILALIASLVQKGYAYPAGEDVYFRTLKFEEYGKLSHQPLDDLESGARIDVSSLKEDPLDFVLWKGAKPGEPMWDSPWGAGRPGWHIECSAMARRYLGETIDIHCGGQDLIFPHHENEIAQSECVSGKEFARFWMHNGYINVDNKKMSKSLNNFFTVRDVAEVYGYEPIRYLMVASHYRSPINYSIPVIEQCKSALERLYNCRNNLLFAIDNAPAQANENEQVIKADIDVYKKQFIKAMDDDLNTADAIAAIFELAKEINIQIIPKNRSRKLCMLALAMLDELCGVLGLLYNTENAGQDIGAAVEDLIARRAAARAEKNWGEADKIRDRIKEMGVILEDTPQGVKWKLESQK